MKEVQLAEAAEMAIEVCPIASYEYVAWKAFYGLNLGVEALGCSLSEATLVQLEEENSVQLEEVDSVQRGDLHLAEPDHTLPLQPLRAY